MEKKQEIKSYLKIVIIEDDLVRGIEGDFHGTLSNLEEKKQLNSILIT